MLTSTSIDDATAFSEEHPFQGGFDFDLFMDFIFGGSQPGGVSGYGGGPLDDSLLDILLRLYNKEITLEEAYEQYPDEMQIFEDAAKQYRTQFENSIGNWNELEEWEKDRYYLENGFPDYYGTAGQKPTEEESTVEEDFMSGVMAQTGKDEETVNVFVDIYGTLIGAIPESPQEAIETIVDFIGSLGGISDDCQTWTDRVTRGNTTYPGWQDCVNVGAILSIPGLNLPFPPGMVDMSVRDILDTLEEVGEGWNDFISDPTGWFENKIEEAKQAVEDWWNGVSDYDGNIINDIYDVVKGAVGSVLVGSVTSTIKEQVPDIFTLFCTDEEYYNADQSFCDDAGVAPDTFIDIQPSVTPGSPCGYVDGQATGEIGSDGETCYGPGGEVIDESEEEEEEIIDDITVDTTQDMVGDRCDSNGDGTLDGTLQVVSGLTFGGGSSDGSQLECVPKATGGEEEIQEEVEEQPQGPDCDSLNRKTNSDGSCGDCKFSFEPNEEGVCVKITFDESVEVNECTNGATNYPDCNQCPPGYVFGGLTFGGGSGECVRDTTAIEDPECNDCTCNDYAAANPLECGWVECPDGSFAPTVEQCSGEGTGCPEGQVPCATLGGECTTPEACPSEEEEESGGGGGGGGGGSTGLFKPFTPTLSGDPELLARQEFPITDFLMGLFTGK